MSNPNVIGPPRDLAAFLWYFIRRQPWAFAVLFCSTVGNILECNVVPYALKLMVDAVTRMSNNGDHAFATLSEPIAIFLGVWISTALVWRGQEFVIASTMPRFEANIRMALFKYVLGHSYLYFSDNFSGTIASKLGNLPRTALSLIGVTRGALLPALWVALTAIVWLGTVSLYFSLILSVWIALHLSISCLLARPATEASNRHAEDETTLYGQIVDVLTNVGSMRLFARQNHELLYIAKYQRNEQDSYRDSHIAVLKARIATDVLLIVMYSVILVLIVKGWQQGWVSPGDIVFVLFTVFNVMSLTWTAGAQIPEIFRAIGAFHQALSLITRVYDVMDAPGAKRLVVTHGEIVFENVHFHYIPSREIFRNNSITIRAGEKVGLVGTSGSGKSTFVNLVLRLFNVESGRILIDGQDIAAVTQDSLRASIAMIPQDTSLLHRTLMDNIRYGRPEATDEEVIAASKQARCHEFILKTEHGYQSLIGERGVKLSGGQRQRIAIARAILKQAPIFILDEATSSLDSVTERYIQEALRQLMRGRTTIVAAHRFSTLACMDRILVFNEGQIIEDGVHEALVEAGGYYARLWRMQVGGSLPESEETSL